MDDWLTKETMDELSFGRDPEGEEFWKEWGRDDDEQACVHDDTQPEHER